MMYRCLEFGNMRGIFEKLRNVLKPYFVTHDKLEFGLSGVCIHKYKSIIIDSNLQSIIKPYVILHERIHELTFKLFSTSNFKIVRIFDAITDISDFYVSDFKYTWKVCLKEKSGHIYIFKTVFNYYLNAYFQK
jgi:hypothetical protein